jgi:hypothetical protein
LPPGSTAQACLARLIERAITQFDFIVSRLGVALIALVGSHFGVIPSRAQELGQPVKLAVIDGRPVAECVYLNGHGPFRFLLDTGAQANQLDPKAARSLGLRATFQTEMVSAASTGSVSGADGIDIALGQAQASGQRFLFGGMDAVQRFASGIHGVLGQEFLSHFDYTLDLRRKRLEFGKMDRPGTRIPLRTTHGLPAVSSSLGVLLLDSGVGQVVLFGVTGNGRTRKMDTVSGLLDAGATSSRPLVIGGRKIRYGEALTVPRQNEKVDAAGLLPLSLFQSVYFCHSEGYVILD